MTHPQTEAKGAAARAAAMDAVGEVEGERLIDSLLKIEPRYLTSFGMHNAVRNEIEEPQRLARKNGDGWIEEKEFWIARCVVQVIQDRLKERGLVITKRLP